MGMTAEGGLEQIKCDISRGIVPKVAFVEFGGNDSDFDWKAINDEPDAEHLPKTPMPAYERTMRKIIETLKSHGTLVILATLPPIISERYFDFLVKKNGLRDENVLHWLGDKNHIYRFQERYSMKISEIAHECGCKLIDLREAFLDKWNTTTYYCSDGIHPNEKGQQLIGDTALAAL